MTLYRWITIGGLIASLCGSALAERSALLVGVGAYKNLPPEAQLKGPAEDVAALKSVLVRRWGFAPENVHTLVDAAATRQAILSELRAMKRRTSPGDEIVYYVSGHGTSAFDAGNRLPLPQGSGAFLPYDANPGSKQPLPTLIVGETDLKPILLELEKSGRRVWAISDSCYSGQQVRSASFAADLPSRQVPVIDADARADLTLVSQSTRIEPYPYRAVSYLSASAAGERARDIPPQALKAFPTLDGKPHGAFTDALLRVLEGQLPGDFDGDGYMSLSEAHRAVADFMSSRGYGHSPQRLPPLQDDDSGLGQQPVLKVSRAAAPSAKAVPNALRVSVHPTLNLRTGLLDNLADISRTDSSSGADLLLTPAPGGRTHLAIRTASGDLIATLPVAEERSIQAQLRQLAWSHRLQQVATAGRRGVLEAAIEPAQMGGNFLAGQVIRFDVKPDRSGHLLVVNINADGRIGILYPKTRSELTPVEGARVFSIGQVRTQAPYGMDQQLLIAFDDPLPQGESWLNSGDMDPADGRIARLESLLTRLAGKYTFAATELRVLPPPTP